MTDFARLEQTTHGQCLIELVSMITDDGRSGPGIRSRIDKGFTVELTAGPYSDDDCGWSAAEKRLAEIVVQDVADELAAMVENFKA